MDLSWPVILDDIILYSHEDVADGISADSTTILGIRYNEKNKRFSLPESLDRQHDYHLIVILTLAPFPTRDSIQTGHCCFDDLAPLSLSIF